MNEVGGRLVVGEYFEVRQLGHAGPSLVGRSAQQFENSFQLVVDIAAGKEWPTGVGQFGEDAASRPAVDGGGVQFGAEQHVRWPVPKGDHFGRKTSHRDSKGSSQPKVGQLELATLVDQKVLRLQVSMQHVVATTIGSTTTEPMSTAMSLLVAKIQSS